MDRRSGGARRRARAHAKRQFLLMLATGVLGLYTAALFKGARWQNIDTLWGFITGWMAILAGVAFLLSCLSDKAIYRRKLVFLIASLLSFLIAAYMTTEAIFPLWAWATGEQNLAVLNPREVRIVLSAVYRGWYLIVGALYAVTAFICLMSASSAEEEPVERVYVWSE